MKGYRYKLFSHVVLKNKRIAISCGILNGILNHYFHVVLLIYIKKRHVLEMLML